MNINPLKNSKHSSSEDVGMKISMSSDRISHGKGNKKPVLMIALVIALIIAVAIGGFFIYQYTQLKPKLDNPTQALDEQSKSIKESVAKLYDLGNLDDYSVASITNIDNLKTDNPDFYKNAKNGDYLVVSQVKAILYNKERNIILGVAPIINDPATSGTPAPTSTVAPTSVPTVQPTQKK